MLGIYQLSKGVQRHSNKICNRLLLLEHGKGNHTIIIDEQDVLEISAEMHEERLAPLESNPTPHYDTDNVTNISDIRDNQLSITDLAISGRQGGYLCHRYRRSFTAGYRGQGRGLHVHDAPPDNRNEKMRAPHIEVAAAVAVTLEPLHAANESLDVTRHSEGASKRPPCQSDRLEKSTGRHGCATGCAGDPVRGSAIFSGARGSQEHVVICGSFFHTRPADRGVTGIFRGNRC